MGPGAYTGNTIYFGRDVQHTVRISPSKRYTKFIEDLPGPDKYDPSLADNQTRPKIIDVRFVKPHNLYKGDPEVKPDPG